MDNKSFFILFIDILSWLSAKKSLTLRKLSVLGMTKSKILFINQEMIPYVGETELSVIGKELPKLSQESGAEIRTFMPKWGTINERRGQLHEVIRLSGMNIIINDSDHPLIIKVASIPQTRVQVYFIDNEDYFAKRLMSADSNGKEYDDNGERAVFFARGVLETVKKLRWAPDVIHCQGWMAAVAPLYVKTAYREEPSFAETKVITSLFNNDLKQGFSNDFKACIEFKDANNKVLGAYPDNMSPDDVYRMAIDFSDGIIEAGSQVDPALLEYAEKKGKPVLRNTGDNLIAACKDFYESI